MSHIDSNNNNNNNDDINHDDNNTSPNSFPNPSAIRSRTPYNTYRPSLINNNNLLNNQEKIHSDYQLTRTERELVRIYFMEATIKGFTIDKIPAYIEIMSKKKITIGYCYYLRNQKYKEDRHWYYQLARDSIAYVGAYREAIDEIKQYKKELWLLIMSDKTEHRIKLDATKELHNLTKTSVLLLRDLPFITNLSRYYDPSRLDPTQQNRGGQQPFKELSSPENELHNQALSEIGDMKIMNKSQFDKTNTSIVKSILDKTKSNKIFYNNNQVIDLDDDDDDDGNDNNKDRQQQKIVDDRIMETMQSQMGLLGYETDEEKLKQKKKEQKEAQDRFTDHQLKALEKNLEEAGDDDEKLRQIQEKYERSLAYLDTIVSPEARENISKLRELTDNKDLV